ncbi:MAG: hypothetical protein AAFN16_26260 [Pseudomonadota bacterium]
MTLCISERVRGQDGYARSGDIGTAHDDKLRDKETGERLSLTMPESFNWHGVGYCQVAV